MPDETTPSLQQLVESAERIGVVGSPSSTSNLSLDILGSAVTKKLVGELAVFGYPQDAEQHYALGQITEVELRNVWHEDPTIRSLIRQRGRVDAVSERQDTHQGEMTVSAVFSASAGSYSPSILGTVPATGTPIHLVEDRVLNVLLSPYLEQLFYLGRVYGSTPRLPLWFKHFGSGRQGAGEAYHLGIFGKTGSGKSVLAKMILLAYARHRPMGLFVIDPQGEFAMGLGQDVSKLSMGTILCRQTLRRVSRSVEVYDLSSIRLDRWEIFGELLVEFGFFFELGIKSSDYQENMADILISFLRGKADYALKNAVSKDMYVGALDFISDNVQRVYSGESYQQRIRACVQEAEDADTMMARSLWKRWLNAARLFATGSGALQADQVVRNAIAPGQEYCPPLVVVDLSKKPEEIGRGVWDEKVKPLLIDRFLDAIARAAEAAYQRGEVLNTLVVIDEAHRLAPRGRVENDRLARIRTNLVNAVRTTRKYGLGWMFLSQTLSSLDSEILQQLRIFFFGFGLSMGSEYDALRQLVGADSKALDLYKRFRDPHSSFDAALREYSFMTTGPVSPLSFAGTPLFFNAFNDPEDFLSANELADG